jgi:hypothetical protein
MAIISNARNAGQRLNLSNLRVDIEDGSFLSEYFVLSEYNPKFTAGKNTFLLNGSDKLAPNTQIQIEALDCFGNSLYVEVAKTNNVAYKEGGAIRVSVYVYNDTPYGVGKLVIVSRDKSNKLIRWIGNIQINPSVQNTSKVIFYKSPTLTVNSTYVPLLTDQSSGYTTNITNTPITTYAIVPKKDDDYGLFDIGSSPIDYRLTFLDNALVVSSSMKNALVTVYATALDGGISTTLTSSNVITDVVDERTVKLKNPIYYLNDKNKKIVSNVTGGSLSATITNVKYDGRFLTSSSINQSVAFVTYKNLKTFSGNIYRHKLYRRSLSSAGDFEIIADEPFVDSQSLIDQSTSNSYFKSLGSFPNTTHVHHYWFSSSTAISFTRDASYLMDAIQITNNTTNEHYVLVKNDTNGGSANHVYTPYDEAENSVEFGMAYDSNFMKFYPDVTYKFSLRSKVVKYDNSKPASVGIYITSSLFDQVNSDASFDTNRGVKIGEIYLDERSSSLYHPDPLVFYNRFANEFNGTMVIYTNNCVSTLSDLQLSTYSEPSFSPEIFITRIPFPVNVPGEQFEIKGELFDVNSNLVYSDLRTITTFDPSGSTVNKVLGITSSDTTNGLTLFNVIVKTEQTSPAQGITMLDASRFNFEASGSSGDNATNGTFYIKKGTVSISPQISGGIGGKVYIKPSTTLEINPASLGTLDNIDIGQSTHKKGKFTDLEATVSATVPTTTAPATVSATVTSTTLASTPGTVDVICPLKTPDGWLLINGKKVPYYN